MQGMNPRSVHNVSPHNIGTASLTTTVPAQRGFREMALMGLTTLASMKAAANQQSRQMLLMTSLIRCSRASSSACSCFHSGVSRFGHGLISWDRAIEAVMSSAVAAGCFVRLAMAGSDDTSCSPRCGCWISARIATCLDAQP